MNCENSLVKGKKTFKVTGELKEKTLRIISRELEKEERVLLAIVFGGFLEKKYTKDADVAVYLDKPEDPVDDYGYTEELGKKLSKLTGVSVDITALNHAPDPILNHVMLKGVVVVNKKPRLLYGLKLLATEQKQAFTTKEISRKP